MSGHRRGRDQWPPGGDDARPKPGHAAPVVITPPDSCKPSRALTDSSSGVPGRDVLRWTRPVVDFTDQLGAAMSAHKISDTLVPRIIERLDRLIGSAP